MRIKDSVLRSISCNADLSCIVCAFAPHGEGKGGYGVFTTHDFSRLAWRVFDTGGFGLAELFDSTNILLLVGGPISPPGFSERSAAFYDDATSRILWDVKLPSPALAVHCKRDLLVAVLDSKIVLYRIGPKFSNVSFLASIDTAANPRGTCALSSDPPSAVGSGLAVIAFPACKEGTVGLAKVTTGGSVGGGQNVKHVSIDPAHQKPISCLALSRCPHPGGI